MAVDKVTDDITGVREKIIRVGITGRRGFIGSHLYNMLASEDGIKLVPFQREYFSDGERLRFFVRSCDVVVHLAGINRTADQQVLHDVNVDLVRQLATALEAEQVRPQLVFASSSQEERDNPYGVSKRVGRRLFEAWAARSGAGCTSLIIPNVFGPFGRPFYNSVVATFCHQLTHGEDPEIHVDGTLKLVYVADLCREIIRVIRGEVEDGRYEVPHCAEKKVSEILATLQGFKQAYFDRQIIPNLAGYVERCLFNTFCCAIDHARFFPCSLTPHVDQRGQFVELLKLDRTGGQVSFSTTKPGVTRGNHYHIRKFERFAVIVGKALICLRRIGTEAVLRFEIDADQCPQFVDMPIWYTHNITNIGETDLFTLFWIDEWYDHQDPDTYFADV